SFFLQEVDHRWKERHVGARHDREADRIHVLLHRRRYDHLRSLVEAGVDDLEPLVTQRAGNDLRSAVVPVQARFRYQDADLAFGGGHRVEDNRTKPREKPYRGKLARVGAKPHLRCGSAWTVPAATA